MEDEEKKERYCGNCKYFIRYYIKNRFEYYAVPMGGCANAKECDAVMYEHQLCERWEMNTRKNR